jgi:hypothetical protein
MASFAPSQTQGYTANGDFDMTGGGRKRRTTKKRHGGTPDDEVLRAFVKSATVNGTPFIDALTKKLDTDFDPENDPNAYIITPYVQSIKKFIYETTNNKQSQKKESYENNTKNNEQSQKKESYENNTKNNEQSQKKESYYDDSGWGGSKKGRKHRKGGDAMASIMANPLAPLSGALDSPAVTSAPTVVGGKSRRRKHKHGGDYATVEEALMPGVQAGGKKTRRKHTHGGEYATVEESMMPAVQAGGKKGKRRSKRGGALDELANLTQQIVKIDKSDK